MSTGAVLAPTVRGRVGEAEIRRDKIGKFQRAWAKRRWIITRKVLGLMAGCHTLLFVSDAIGADETRWRLVKFDDGVRMLVMTDTDGATDAIGSLYFRCKSKSGYATVKVDIRDRKERLAIADWILNDGYPTLELTPAPEKSVLETITLSDSSGWGYDFQIDVNGAAFNAFSQSGYFQFKIGSAVVKAGVEAGLDKVAEFRAVCRRPSTPGVLDNPKAQK